MAPRCHSPDPLRCPIPEPACLEAGHDGNLAVSMRIRAVSSTTSIPAYRQVNLSFSVRVPPRMPRETLTLLPTLPLNVNSVTTPSSAVTVTSSLSGLHERQVYMNAFPGVGIRRRGAVGLELGLYPRKLSSPLILHPVVRRAVAAYEAKKEHKGAFGGTTADEILEELKPSPVRWMAPHFGVVAGQAGSICRSSANLAKALAFP